MKLLNARCDNPTVPDAIEKMLAMAKGPSKSDVFYMNIDCLRLAEKDLQYRALLNEASLVLPDGVGLRLIARHYGYDLQFDCKGITDFFTSFIQKAAEGGLKIFLLGGRPGVADEASEKFKSLSPSAKMVGTHSGYFDSDQAVVDRINASGADILVVGMGAPLQEKWIDRNRAHLDTRLCIGVGALFDFWSHRVPRAPKIVQALNLEWVWRLCIEPGRLAKRYWNDITFLLSVLKKRRPGSA